MSEPTRTADNTQPRPAAPSAESGSNALRLSLREWGIALAVVAVVLYLLPAKSPPSPKIPPAVDYRMPYELSNDYWLYGRNCESAALHDKTLVVGDSVIWGQYVATDQTLVHDLNALAGADRFANLGLDGAHPIALAGLIEHYGRAIAGKRVVLYFNPLWITSKKHDLRTDKEFQFNHPRLVPQFVPSIPCYTASYTDRLGIVMEQNLPFLAWAAHLRTACFAGMSVPGWTLEHPYSSPLAALAAAVPPADKGARHGPQSWTARGMDRSDFPWVELDTSLQWAAFRRLIGILKTRGNDVVVLVGPFNEHMLAGASVETYAQRKRDIGTWLQANRIGHYVPAALPSDYYADASHPLSAGYGMLARQLFENSAFARMR